MSILVSSVSYAADSFFATLFSSDCRPCRTPLINLSRLAACQPFLSCIGHTRGGVCSLCGERWLAPYAVVAGASKIDVVTVARIPKPGASSGGLLPGLAETGTLYEEMQAAS